MYLYKMRLFKLSSKYIQYILILGCISTTQAQAQKQTNMLANPTTKNSTATSTFTKFRLPDNYSKEQRPSQHGEATLVHANIHVQAINPIKAADMDFRMDMTLTQRWTDNRLQFPDEQFDVKDHFILPLEFIDQIWHPNPFVVNAKSTDVGQLTQKLVSVYIFKNNTVQYFVNVFATVACAMNYRYYPFDSQLCPMYIESFSFDESQVKSVWADTDAFTINPRLRMLQFVPTALYHSAGSVPRFNEAKNFSQLIAYFRFDRLLGNHLIQTFAPCSLVVCLSWFSFWLELNALSARMSLLVTSILTLVTQFAGLKADLPPVAYIKAVDIWMAGCMVWVFGALGEFVLAKVIYSLTEDAKFIYHESHMQLRSSNGATRVYQNPDENIEPSQTHPNSNRELQDDQPGDRISPALSANQEFRRRGIIGLERLGSLHSIATTSSATLDKNLGKVHIPLQWTDHKTGKQILLWKKIDNFSKSAFPLTFAIFCTIYWIVLYIHSIAMTEIDFIISSNSTSN